MVSLTDTEHDYYLALEEYARDISLGLNVVIAQKLMKKLILKRYTNDIQTKTLQDNITSHMVSG